MFVLVWFWTWTPPWSKATMGSSCWNIQQHGLLVRGFWCAGLPSLWWGTTQGLQSSHKQEIPHDVWCLEAGYCQLLQACSLHVGPASNKKIILTKPPQTQTLQAQWGLHYYAAGQPLLRPWHGGRRSIPWAKRASVRLGMSTASSDTTVLWCLGLWEWIVL